MSKKAVIVVRLVDESTERTNEELEKEIWLELSTSEPKIPWFKSVEKVTIVEET